MSVAEILPPAKDPANGRFIPGNSGGPGKPKGCRNKLGEAFVQALHEHFQEHGVEAIERVCREEPGAYLRVIAQVVPKDLILHSTPMDSMGREDIRHLVDTLQRALQTVATNPAVAREVLASLPMGTQ